MKVLVTGGSGFIGSHLIDHLAKKGHEVYNFDLVKPIYNSVPTYEGSILAAKEIRSAVLGKDFVFHLAGMLGTHELVDNAKQGAEVNILGTLNVLDACKESGAKLIEISKPNCWVNTYTITKIAAESFTEMYRREHAVKAATIKWFNVYGSRQPLEEESGYKKLVPTAIMNALKGKEIEVYGNGEQTMDLIHTIDTVEATEAIMNNFDKCEGKVFEIGEGKETRVNDLVKIITDKLGGKVKHIPMRKGEWANTSICADIDPIKKLTGWKPRISLKEGLEETINFYKWKLKKLQSTPLQETVSSTPNIALGR